MAERTARVVCPYCSGVGSFSIALGEWIQTNLCSLCGGSSMALATLTDPETEALIADGERWRDWWRDEGVQYG